MSNPIANSLTVSFRGVRGSTPAPGDAMARYGGNTSCVEVRAGNQIVILDAGTGIRELGVDLLKEFETSPIEVALLISHTHWDHIQGLPFFTPAYSVERKIRVLSARGAGAGLTRALRNQMDPIHFPVNFDRLLGLIAVEELASDDVTLGPFRVRVTALNHPGGCAGFRIEANGGSLAYLPDHEPFENDSANDALVEFVRDVDLLILDTQYTEAEFQLHRGWGHGCLPNSVALAVNARVRRLAFFHHDPGHDDEQIDRMVECARSLARPAGLIISAASEHETIVIENASAPLLPSPPLRVAASAAI
jgi:phosphoribosyl 1,2-cyclic phosphodiesterase